MNFFSSFGKPKRPSVTQEIPSTSTTTSPVIPVEKNQGTNPYPTNYARMMFLLENEPKLRKAKTLIEFFEILEKGKLQEIPLEKGASIAVDALMDEIKKYLEELHGRIPAKGAMFFNTFAAGEISYAGKSFEDTLEQLIFKEAEKRAAQVEEMSAENRVIELEIKPRLLQAKSRLEFFGILESENIKNIPFSGGNSIPAETLNNAIIKYILNLKGKIPAAGEMFFDVVSIGEVQGIGQEFKDVLNRLILKEITEAGEDSLCRVTFESNRQNLPQAKTLAEFLKFLSEGGLQKIPLTSGDFLEIEKLKESILEYISKQGSSPDGSLFFDTFIVGEISGMGQKFKDILNQLILKNKELDEEEDTSGFAPTQSPDDINTRPVEVEFPAESLPTEGVPDISDTLENDTLSTASIPRPYNFIAPEEKVGYNGVNTSTTRDQIEIAPGIFEESTVPDLSNEGLGFHNPDKGIVIDALPAQPSLEDVKARVEEAVSDFPKLPDENVALDNLRDGIHEALKYESKNAPDAVIVEKPATLKPNAPPSHRLKGTGLLGTLRKLRKEVVDFVEEKEGKIAKQVTGWQSKFRNGFNRLITKDTASEKETPSEGDTFDVHPEEIASILTASPTSPESHTALEALSSVDKRTDNLLQNALETSTGAAKTILEKVELLGEKFNRLPKSVRYGTGIAIAGLGASGAPLVVPALALATVFRVASGAGLYATLHKALENTYAKEEAAGRKVKVLRKQVMGAGAITVSAFAGYAIGQYISGLFPTDEAVHTTGPAVSQIDSAASAPVPVPEVVASAASAPDVEAITQAASEQVAQEVVAAPAHEMIHIVVEDENLWTIVKDHLMRSDAFTDLSEQAKNIEISKYLAAIQEAKIFPHGIDNIHAGDVVDFSQFDGKIPEDILKHVTLFTK